MKGFPVDLISEVSPLSHPTLPSPSRQVKVSEMVRIPDAYFPFIQKLRVLTDTCACDNELRKPA